MRAIPARDLSDHTIVGDHGGTTHITGEVNPSNVIPGCVAVETEHGTIYLEADLPVLILTGDDLSGLGQAMSDLPSAAAADSNDREIEALGAALPRSG